MHSGRNTVLTISKLSSIESRFTFKKQFEIHIQHNALKYRSGSSYSENCFTCWWLQVTFVCNHVWFFFWNPVPINAVCWVNKILDHATQLSSASLYNVSSLVFFTTKICMSSFKQFTHKGWHNLFHRKTNKALFISHY